MVGAEFRFEFLVGFAGYVIACFGFGCEGFWFSVWFCGGVCFDVVRYVLFGFYGYFCG